MSPREHVLLVSLYRKNADIYVIGLNSCKIVKQWWGYTHIAHSGDNWQTLTNVMEKKGTMAAHALELPSPDMRWWNLKQTIPVILMFGI